MGSPDPILIHSLPKTSSCDSLMLNASTQVLVSWKKAENARGQVKLKLHFNVLNHKRELQLQTVSNTPVSFPLHLAMSPLFDLQVGKDEVCNTSLRSVRGDKLHLFSKHLSSLLTCI